MNKQSLRSFIIGCLILIFTLGACRIAPAGQWTIENAFNAGDLNGVEFYIAPEFVLHTPDLFDGLNGVDGFTAWVNAWRTMLPDMHVALITVGGDPPDWDRKGSNHDDVFIAIRDDDDILDGYTLHLSGTHTGRYEGIQPTGQEIIVVGQAVARYHQSQMVELWLRYDSEQLALNLSIPDAEFVRDMPVIDLSGADFRGAFLAASNLEGVDLSGANLINANLNQANLRNADLRGANMEWAMLIEANLQDAILSDADLRGVHFGGANLIGTDFTDAVFSEDTTLVDGMSGERSCMTGCWASDTDMSRYTNPEHPDFHDPCDLPEGIVGIEWLWYCNLYGGEED